MKTCKFGPFQVPGIEIEGDVSEEIVAEITAWADSTRCGIMLTNRRWSFRNEDQRTIFILRWAEIIKGIENKNGDD